MWSMLKKKIDGSLFHHYDGDDYCYYDYNADHYDDKMIDYCQCCCLSDEKIDGDDDYFHAMVRMDYDFYENIVMRKMQKLVEEEVDDGDNGDENGDVDGDAEDDVDDDEEEVHDEGGGEDDDDADDVALEASSPLLEQLAVVVAVERTCYCHCCYYKHLPSTCCDDEDVTVEMVVHYWNSCLCCCGWTDLRVVGLLYCYWFDGWKICYCC